MRYSNDLRKKDMDMHFVQKKNMVEVSKLLNIGYNTLKFWKKKFKEKADSLYKITPSSGRKRAYDYEKLKEFVEKNPDKYIREIQKEIFEKNGQKASFGGIHKALKSLDLKLKKKSSCTKKKTRKEEKIISKKVLN